MPFQGYVTVGVNLRGTTCSGGALSSWRPQASTGMTWWRPGPPDVVEWQRRHGRDLLRATAVSTSGRPTLRTCGDPPASPYSDTYSGILYPGGILNDGFALGWATEREQDALPKAHTWVKNRITNGDTVCAENQVLRLQAKPLLDRIHNTPFADHEFDYLNTETFVHKIKMPVYLSAQWQDEQTGGSSANLIPFFDPANKRVFGDFTNGVHVEPMGPEVLEEQLNFVDLYVGKRVPHISNLLAFGIPSVLADLFHATDRVSSFYLPYDLWTLEPNYAAALAKWEAQPRAGPLGERRPDR